MDGSLPVASPDASLQRDGPAATPALAALVGRVYEAAPLFERARMLEQLIEPMGPLALAGVADGILARMRSHDGRGEWRITLTDAQRVEAPVIVSLIALIDRTQPHAIDALARPLRASPTLSARATTTALLLLLDERNAARRRHAAGLDANGASEGRDWP